MFNATDIQNLLACPVCKGSLHLETLLKDELGVQRGKLRCLNCKKVYPIEQGIFYLQPGSEDVGTSEGWDLSSFNKAYHDMGYYKSSCGWREKQGIPRQVTDYDYPKVKGRLLNWLAPQDGDIVLDVGAGVGYFIFEMMRKYAGKQVFFVGIDSSREHIKWLEHRKREEKKSNILTIVGDARALPFGEGKFDTVVSTEVLEHVPDKEKVIGEISYGLKPGGKLLLSTPSRSAIAFWRLSERTLRWAFKSSEHDNAPYDEPLHPRVLESYLRDAGFSINNFELNVILPPQSSFSRYPLVLARIILWICGFIEKHMKTLFARFALHIVLSASK